MATGQSNPFSDASEFNSLQFIIARALDGVQTVTVAKVTAVDTGAQTVDVLVLVNLITGKNTPVPHGVISARPYFRLQGGGNGIIIDPVVGDIGVVVFGSRDLTSVIATKGAANPPSARRFSWADGIYFGGILNQAPTQYVQFMPAGGGITIHSPGDLTLDAPLTEVTGDLIVDGDTTVDGTSTLTGAVTAPAGVTTAALVATTGTFSGNISAANFPGGGGGGGVSSVATGTGLTGGPITSSGTISLDSTTIASLALANSALQALTSGTGITVTGASVALSSASIAGLVLAASALQPNAVTTSVTNANLTIVNGQITVATSGSGGGGSLTVTDGTTAVTGVTTIKVIGATVSTPSGGEADITITGGGSAPVPETIPDLIYYWQADLANVSSGGTISRMVDSTPWAQNHAGAVQSSSNITRDATQLNSKNVFTWTANSPGRSAFTTGLGILTKVTFFIVVKPNNTGSNPAFNISCLATNGLRYTQNGSTSQQALVQDGTAVIANASTAMSNGTWYQLNASYDAATGAYVFRLGQAADGSGTNAVSITQPTTSLGFTATSGAEDISGSIAEIIIYNRVLTLTEKQTVEAYLHTKWGV